MSNALNSDFRICKCLIEKSDHEDDQSDHVNIRFSIELNKLILSNKSRSVCTIEQID